MPGIFDIVKEYLPLAGPAVSLLQGLFGKSAEDQYNEANQRNLERTVAAIRANTAVQRARAQRQATRDTSLATQAGSRQYNVLGGRGDSTAYSDQNVSRIHRDLTETNTRLDENQTAAIASATAGVRDEPSYMFPHTADYVSSALTTAGQYFTGQEELGYQRGMEERRQSSQDAFINALKPKSSLYGSQDSDINESIARIQQRGNRFP